MENLLDAAFKQNINNDPTAMVFGYIYGYGKEMKIFIAPGVVNKRLAPNEALEQAKITSLALGNGTPTKLVIEDVGGQYAFIDLLKQESFPVEGFQLRGQDKYERPLLECIKSRICIKDEKVFLDDRKPKRVPRTRT